VDITVVWNSKAGSAAKLTAADVATRLGARIIECGEGGDPVACARQAVESGARVVVAAGGDGTVSACASALIGTRAALGVLPLGTSNSFAAALEIPDDIEEALALIASNQRRVIDAAVVERGDERRTMVLHCMIGLHAETIASTDDAAKKRWGVLAYAGTGLGRLAKRVPFGVGLQTSHQVVRGKAIQISAANLAPLKTVLAHGPSHLLGDDGLVDVTIVAAETLAEAVATGVHLYRTSRDGEAATRDNVGSFSAKRVEVRCDPPQAVLVDGEPFETTPVTITTMPRALIVCAPQASVAQGDPVEASLEGLPDLEVERR